MTQVQGNIKSFEPENQPENQMEEIFYFCKTNSWLCIITWILVFAVWGTWISHDIITFDAEGLYNKGNAELWYLQWYALGRPFLVLAKRLLGVLLINPYFSNTIVLLCFPLSAIIWSAFIERSMKKNIGYYKLLFVLSYITHPVWALMFSYRMHMEVLSVVMLLLPVGMLYFISWLENGVKADGVIAFIAVVISFGSFQSFMILFMDAAVIYLFLCLSRNEKEVWVKKCRMTIEFAILAFACWLILAYITGYNPGNSYAMSQFGWGEVTFQESIYTIVVYIAKSMFGNGLEYNATYGIVSIVFIIYCILFGSSREKHSIHRLILGIGVCLIPFLLEIFSAGNIPSRSQYAFVLSCSFMIIMDMKWICRLLGTKRSYSRALLGILALLILIPETEITTRLLYSDVQTMQRDHQIFQSMYDRATLQGAEPGYALYIRGGQANVIDESFLETEIVGYSYFEFSRHHPEDFDKVIYAMQAYGYPVRVPSMEQIQIGNALAGEMEMWPDQNSVRVLPENELIIINMEYDRQ